MREDDDLLARRATRGDRAAVEEILVRHYADIARLCRRIAADPTDAEDCTQEALIAVVRGLPSFDHRSKLSTWIYRVTTNACLDELRRRSRRGIPVDPSDPAGPLDRSEHAPGGGTVGGSRDPVADLDGVTTAIDLDRALVQIPFEFRVPLVLREVADLDYRQIADHLDVPVGTVKSRIARGRAALAKVLGGPDDDRERT